MRIYFLYIFFFSVFVNVGTICSRDNIFFYFVYKGFLKITSLYILDFAHTHTYNKHTLSHMYLDSLTIYMCLFTSNTWSVAGPLISFTSIQAHVSPIAFYRAVDLAAISSNYV